MNVLEFKMISSDYKYDVSYETWSRIYEYPLVLDLLKKYSDNTDITIHNTSWGFGGCHITFKNKLDDIYKNSLHTDIKASTLKNTDIYDITQSPPEKFINYFDFVLNISTLEEVRYDHIKTFNNLLSMVRSNGYLILTFDLPGLQLERFENMLERKIDSVKNPINGRNSKISNGRYEHLNCGYLVIQKEI